MFAPGATAPATSNGIVNPTIVGLSGATESNGFIQADFLTYNSGTGFGVTTNYTSHAGSFSTALNEIANVNFTSAGTISESGNNNPYAMVINSSTCSSGWIRDRERLAAQDALLRLCVYARRSPRPSVERSAWAMAPAKRV